MTGINVSPPVVSQEWEKIDTSIDRELPLCLSRDQFVRYCATIRDLLQAAGLQMEDHGRTSPDFLVVHDEDLGMHMRIELNPDRMGSVEVRFEDDLVAMPDTVGAASFLMRLFEAARAFEQSRPRLP